MTAVDEALAFLTEHGIEYELAEHERVSSIEECALPMKLLHALMPRNYFLCPRNQCTIYLLAAHPDSVFRTSSVSRQAGASRLSFAPEEKISELLHTFAGAVSPLGLIYDPEKKIRLLWDKRLISEEQLLFHPLINTMSVKVRQTELLTALNREITYIDMETK